MADKETVERIVVIDPAEHQRRAAEAKMAEENSEEAKRLRNSIPGAVYGIPGQEGRFVDAHGREVDEKGNLVGEQQPAPSVPTMQIGGPAVTDAAKAQAEESESEAWRKDMLEQRRESMSEPPPDGSPVVSFTTLPSIEDEEEEVDDSGKKTGRKVKRAATKRGRK